jgi:hypothetical protein
MGVACEKEYMCLRFEDNDQGFGIIFMRVKPSVGKSMINGSDNHPCYFLFLDILNTTGRGSALHAN